MGSRVGKVTLLVTAALATAALSASAVAGGSHRQGAARSGMLAIDTDPSLTRNPCPPGAWRMAGVTPSPTVRPI